MRVLLISTAAALSLATALHAGPTETPVVAAPAAAAPTVAAAPAKVAAPETANRPMALSRLVIRMPAGKVWANIQGGLFCIPSAKPSWKGGQQDLKGNEYLSAFHDAMKDAGYKVEGDPDNLFETNASVTDYQIAGIITNIDAHACLPKVGYGNSSTIRGGISVDMEWQVYSSLRKVVVSEAKTHGQYDTKGTESGGMEGLLLNAFRENLKDLASNGAFRKTFEGPPIEAGDLVKPTSRATITLSGSLAAEKRPVGDTVASVVTLFAGNSQGSGFLVSSDGLLLTDQHVVGDVQYVKVRWPDGIETLGEVVRTDKVRDVALVKTDPRGRKPLRLRLDAPQVGDTVYAIGAPLDVKFASTVTRGVISASRTFEGLSFLQSDVGVNPGSSGGPLLDENGAAVGVTEAGVRIGGAPEGINLFTPIRDALEFLGAEPK